MEFHRNSMPSVDGHTTVVTGASLGEAFKRVRAQFGPEAVISGSRTRSRRNDRDGGTEKFVEVLVETPGAVIPGPRKPISATMDIAGDFRQEVERIERMVDEICQPSTGEETEGQPTTVPLAEYLVENGASPAAVGRILTRFSVETGSQVGDRPAALLWLREYLQTSLDSLGNLRGHHVFLSENSGENLDIILNLAPRLTKSGRRVLVVSVLPDPDRDETPLKAMASAAGFDAAVVRDVEQLTDIGEHLDSYNIVLAHLPGLADSRLAEGGPVHRWLATHPDFHRHLLLPMDRDFLDLEYPLQASRSWNCDCLSLTRMDRTGRPAKILDLLDRIPLPVSFMALQTGEKETFVCATPDHLLDRILTSAGSVDFRPGLTIDKS